MKKALVLAFAFVMALGIGVFADALSGSWSTDICVDGTPTFTSFDSTLVVNYEICGWTFGGTFGFGVDGWETVAFDVYGALGAFAVDSNIVFSPADAKFWYWMSTVDLAIAGIDLTLGYDLVMDGAMLLDADGVEYEVGGDYSYWTIGASGAAGLCNIGITAGFGIDPGAEEAEAAHCFCFDYINFTFDFPFLCGTTVYVDAGFSTAGFDGLFIDITGLYFVELPWLTFDFGLSFTEGTGTPSGKSFSFVPAISLTDACDEDAGYISLFVELYSDGATFDGINVYGIDIYKAWNGIWFQDLTSFEDAMNVYVTGYAAYWEAMGIGTVGDSCCGGDFSFEVWTYFDHGDYLFDWALTTVALSFGIGSNFDVTSSFSIDADGLLELCMGFAVSW